MKEMTRTKKCSDFSSWKTLLQNTKTIFLINDIGESETIMLMTSETK